MSLNLKNPRAYELASELADLTGETLTTAVILALENRLRAEREKRAPKRKADRMLEFAARFSQGIEQGATSQDPTDMFYDDAGMPK